MNRRTLSTIILTTICIMWIGYVFSIISKCNAPVFHIISIPLSKGVLFVLVMLTLTLIIAECAVVFNRRVLFTLLSLPFVLLLFSLFLTPSMWLSLKIRNETQTSIKIHCINVISHANLSRIIKSQKDGYVVLNEGESKELLSKEVFIILAYDLQGNIVYSKRMTGKEIFGLEQLTISGEDANVE